jgi:ribosome recycling factor
MPLNDVYAKTQSAMKKAIDHLHQEFLTVRTGRATASLLDSVRVDYYGSPTPLNQIGSVSVPDARTIVVQPFEKTMLGAAERAIREADLGFNPTNDGNVVRVPVPMLTEERRKDLVKQCKKTAEDSRVAVRNIRRDHIELVKRVEKDEHLSEDQRKDGEAEVQKITDRFIKEIDDVLAKKEQEVMAV